MAWIHFLSARAAGAVGNALILARALNENILEDEERSENDSLSDGSEEGSEGSGGDNGNEDEHDCPLRDSWNEAVRCGRLARGRFTTGIFSRNSLLLEMALVKHMI